MKARTKQKQNLISKGVCFRTIIIRKPNPITTEYPIALDAKPTQTLLLRFPSFFDFPSSQRPFVSF